MAAKAAAAQSSKLARLSHIADKEARRGRPVGSRAKPATAAAIQAAQDAVFGPLALEGVELEINPRSRTHMNPLAMHISAPVPAPSEWGFADPSLPLFVDVGCAAGRFALLMASKPASEIPMQELVNVNFLGMEIKPKLVERAQTWAAARQLSHRVQFIQASANSSLEGICRGYPGPVRCICVQFPDPHFKRKHHKRRVVDSAFLRVVINVLEDKGFLFVQSDVEEAAAQMRDRADMVPELERLGEYSPRDALLDACEVCAGTTASEAYWTQDGKRALEGGTDYGDWRLGPNPLGTPTEREVQNETLGQPIFRALYRRKPRSSSGSAAGGDGSADGECN